MKILLAIVTVSLMLTPVLAMETIVDEPSQDEKSLKTFERLRSNPEKLTMDDFRDIYKLMQNSFSIKNKGDQTYYRGNYEIGDYCYTIFSHYPLSKVFNEKELEYQIHLKSDPKQNLFQTVATFEVLVDSKRLSDFRITYVSKLPMKLLKGDSLLKQFQAKITKISLERFLERPPLQQDVTIKKSRDALHKAQVTADEVKQSLEERYKDTPKEPLTSRGSTRRRAFSELRSVTRAHIESSRYRQRRAEQPSSKTDEEKNKSSNTDAGKEKKEKKELKKPNPEKD